MRSVRYPTARLLAELYELWLHWRLRPSRIFSYRWACGPWLGGYVGVESLLPFALVRSDMGNSLATLGGGAGDITLAPLVECSGLPLLDHPLSIRASTNRASVMPTNASKVRRRGSW